MYYNALAVLIVVFFFVAEGFVLVGMIQSMIKPKIIDNSDEKEQKKEK